MKNLLIVDSDPITLHTIMGLLKSQGAFFDVVSAENNQVAFKIIDEQKIHLVISGLHLPEIAHLELLTKMEKEYPDIPLIMMNSNASALFRDRVKQMASAIHFGHELDLTLLLGRIFSELNIDYGGCIRGVSLPSFMQLIELEGRSCTLKIQTKGKTGSLAMDNGELIGAESGNLSGRMAALEILTWKGVTIDIDYTPPTIQRDISKPLMSLIMESGRLIDEELQSDQRKHDRVNCLVAVDYDLSQSTYQCCLVDLSLGGAYILTGQPIQVGQRIIISLASTDNSHGATVIGLVTRRDQNGIGVKFEDLSLQQKKMIEQLQISRCDAQPL